VLLEDSGASWTEVVALVGGTSDELSREVVDVELVLGILEVEYIERKIAVAPRAAPAATPPIMKLRLDIFNRFV
jgi:hypothetical protein